jgi:hypothetical protein
VEAFDLHDLFSEDVNVCKPGLTMGSGGYLCVLAAAVLKRPAAAGTVVLQAARSLKEGGLLLLSEPGAHSAALEAARKYAEESGLFVAGASGEYSAPQKAKGRTLDKAHWFALERTSAAAVDCEPLFKGLTRKVCGHTTATGAMCKKPCDFWLYDIGTEEGHRPGSTTSVEAVQRISTHINYDPTKTKGGGSQALWNSAIHTGSVRVWRLKSEDLLPELFEPLFAPPCSFPLLKLAHLTGEQLLLDHHAAGDGLLQNVSTEALGLDSRTGGRAWALKRKLTPGAEFAFASAGGRANNSAPGGRASSSKGKKHAKHRQRPGRLPPGIAKGKCRLCGLKCGAHIALCQKGRGCNNKPAGKGKD